MRRATTWSFALGLACLVPSCASDRPGMAPPDDVFYFPIGVATSLDGRYAYVASSNFDLRFKSGWVSVVDLDALIAGEGRETVVVGHVAVPSLAGEIGLSADGALIALGHRGTGVLTLLEVSTPPGGVPALSCGVPNATAGLGAEMRETDCDRAHLHELGPRGADAGIDSDAFVDPYAVLFVDDAPAAGQRELLVGFQSRDGGLITQFDVSGDLPPALSGQRSVFPERFHFVNQLALHPDRTGGAFVVATGGTFGSPAVLGLDLARPEDPGTRTGLSDVAGGQEALSVAFSPDGGRAFVTLGARDRSVRVSEGVILLDSALRSSTVESDGVVTSRVAPSYTAGPVTALDGIPTSTSYVARAAGDLIVASGFSEDVLYALSAAGPRLQVIARIDLVAKGPYRTISVKRGARELVLITTFLDHGLLVIDVTDPEPANWSQHHLRDPSLPEGDRRR